MAEGVPLKPRLGPGQHRGRWSVSDETGAMQHLDGDLDLLTKRQHGLVDTHMNRAARQNVRRFADHAGGSRAASHDA